MLAVLAWTTIDAASQPQASSTLASDLPLVANTLVITKGGTYSGNWVSTDPAVPAVTVQTDAPVTIENSTVMSRGNLIVATGTAGANLTVRDVSGKGLDPLIAGKQRGAFVVAYIMNSLTVKNCTMDGTSFGVKAGFSALSNLSVLNNIATNLEDRASDGNGGFQMVRPQLGHFALLYQVSALGDAEIAWNQVTQTMGQSSVDDVITLYNSRGSASQPISVHDNYMEGYSSPAATYYSGSGISSTGDSTVPSSSYALFHANQMVHTAGNGLGIFAGHDIAADANRVVSCGRVNAGTWYSHAGLAAIVLRNRLADPTFANNTVTNTAGGLIVPNTANAPVPSNILANPADLLTPSNHVSGSAFDDPCLTGSLYESAEDQERALWSTKLTANGQQLGDQHSPVQIAITPAGLSAGPTQTQQFTAYVSWASNHSVTWTMSPAGGTLSQDGLYTAPATITAPQTVSVTITSTADPSQTASATIQLVPPVVVSVSPGVASITSAQTLRLNAIINNTPNTGVAWSLTPAVGTISPNGVYTPPTSLTSQQMVAITATSLADHSKSATAMLTVTPLPIAMTPMAVPLAAGQSQQFSATLQNGQKAGILWSISPAIGSITAAGLYTAPASITSVQVVTITAANAANTTQWITGRITLLPPIKVNLLSNYAVLTVSQTVQLAAVVQNSSDADVIWSLDPSVGTLSSTGLYTAPTVITRQQSLTFTATSVADPTKSASGTIVLNPPVSITVVPASVTLPPAGVQQFAGNVAWSKNTSVLWSLTPTVGTISSAGLYTAPIGTTSVQQVAVTATSAADPTKSSTAVLTLNPPVSVSVSPKDATTTLGQTQLLTGNVRFANNTAVVWSISPAVGTISVSGRYTPPATPVAAPVTVTVTATSVADSSKSDTATLTVNPPASVAVSPTAVSLAASQSTQFGAVVRESENAAVIWSISPALGSITADGVFTAPGSVTSVQSVTVTATLVSDPSKYANTSVTLLPPVKVNLVSAYASVSASQTAQFSAQVQNASNTSVTWSIVPAFGNVSTNGLYTAPQSVATQQTVMITATSIADPSKAACGTVVINPPLSVHVVPQSVTLAPSKSQQFTGNVAWSSTTAVKWSVTPAVGSVSPDGLYTAPVNTASPQTVVVTATSVVDPAKSSSATVLLNPLPSVVVAPLNATVFSNQTLLFTAEVDYSTDTAVTWSVDPAVGSISASGRYTPPTVSLTAPQRVTVTATTVADPTRSSSVVITVNPAPTISLTPLALTLAAAQQQQFNAAVQWASDPTVSWSITPALGTMSQTGLYTAPQNIDSVQQVTVTALSRADNTKYATASIRLLPPIKVNLLANYASVAAAHSTTFSAVVQNAPDTRVTWSIMPALGSISASGTYTAPDNVASQQTLTVTATSVEDTTKTAAGTIVVNPAVTIAVVPATATLTSSHTQQFTAYVAWNNNTAVTWSMLPVVGTLSQTGLYTAPGNIATNQTVTVTATSIADPTKSTSAVIQLRTLLGPDPIVITEAGTYTGNWVSKDPNVPAVTVSTDATVVIQNSTVQGPGHLIQITGTNGANVSVYNVTGTSTDPNVIGRQRGAFIRAAIMHTLTVSNCTMIGSAFGIQVSSSTLTALSIQNNKGINLEDRASDGTGGLQVARPQLGHFIVLHNVVAPNGADIGWNQLQQTVGQSSTEDVINIYHSQGTAANLINVHDNYMEGYSSSTTPTYTGNGLISDGDSTNISAYIVFRSNQMVHTAGGGIAIANGHDVQAIGNRVVSCGVDGVGQWYSRPGTAAVALWNYYNAPDFYNNAITQTSGGLVSPGPNGQPLSSDTFVNAADVLDSSNSVVGNSFTDPCLVNGRLNISAEDDERASWSTKLLSNGISVGDSH